MATIICFFCRCTQGWHTPFCNMMAHVVATELREAQHGIIQVRALPLEKEQA